jgi:hypothetical protein
LREWSIVGATISWRTPASSRFGWPLVPGQHAIPDAAARAKIFGATARDLYFNGK